MQGRANFLKGLIVGTAGSGLALSLYNYDVSSSKHDTNTTGGGPNDYLHQRGKEILKYGIPDRGPDVRPHLNHVLCYDQAKKTPMWVAEHLTKAGLEGVSDRENSYFRPDPTMDRSFSSDNSDYKYSGYARGHMAPAGDNKLNQDTLNDTFYLTNILPQDFDNNKDFWNRMEIYWRDLTERFPEVRVFSGPLMMANMEEGTKKFAKYEVIGPNGVTVPTHLFKLIVADHSQTSEGQVAIGAFVIPNEPIDGSAELKHFKVSLERLEESAGMRLLPDLPRAQRMDLCSVDSCELMSQEAHQLYFVERMLKKAKTVEKLDEEWAELEKNNLKPDNNLTELYKKRKEELSQA